MYLADDVLHLLSMDDLRGVDDTREARPVHLSGVLVLSLMDRQKKTSVNTRDVKVHTSFTRVEVQILVF